MNIPAKADYACKAVLELSLHWPNQAPMQVAEIAKKQHIPLKFLTHILLSLKEDGILLSLRGKNGGYLLARSPKEIRLLDVIGNYFEPTSAHHASHKSKKVESRVLEEVYDQISSSMQAILRDVNFAELSNRHRNAEKIPMFTI